MSDQFNTNMKPVSLEVTMMKRIGELNAENAQLKALTIEMDKTINISQAGCRQLKAEVERLTAFTTRTIIPNELLRAEVERLTNNCDYLDKKLDEELDKSAMLCGQVERLTKAGDAMASFVDWDLGTHPSVEAWNAAKEGKTK